MTDPLHDLVRRAVRQGEPSSDVRDDIYRATREAWLRQRRQRVHRRQLAIAASLLGFALLAGIGWMNFGAPAADPHVAAIERFVGDVGLRHDSGAGREVEPRAGSPLIVGEQIDTAPGSRLVLRRPGGILLHVAGGSQLVWQTANAVRLTRGLVYVDTGGAVPGTDSLEIVTHTGSIRHIGTRFSVQVADDLEVRVMVRDGAVRIGNARNDRRLDAGQGARIARDGEVLASSLTLEDGPWQWLGAEQPRFPIEGRTLHAVLEDLALAEGEPLRYASSDVEAEARNLKLHGPALELGADAATAAVLLTTRFTRQAPFEIVARP